MSTRRNIILLVTLFLMVNGVFFAALADYDEHKEKRWDQELFDWDDDDDNDDDDHHVDNRRGSKHSSKRCLNPVSNPTYKERCGARHFAYQPEFAQNWYGKKWVKDGASILD